jgi:hypothetical protein
LGEFWVFIGARLTSDPNGAQELHVLLCPLWHVAASARGYHAGSFDAGHKLDQHQRGKPEVVQAGTGRLQSWIRIEPILQRLDD